MADEQPDTGAAVPPFKVQFHYIKGPTYHETVCHGAIGGPTPQGKIWMALYSERNPLPRMVEYHVPAPAAGSSSFTFNENAAGPPHYVESRQGVVRHVEYSTYMDLETAENLSRWLSEQIAQIKRENKK